MLVWSVLGFPVFKHGHATGHEDKAGVGAKSKTHYSQKLMEVTPFLHARVCMCALAMGSECAEKYTHKDSILETYPHGQLYSSFASPVLLFINFVRGFEDLGLFLQTDTLLEAEKKVSHLYTHQRGQLLFFHLFVFLIELITKIHGPISDLSIYMEYLW